MIYNIRVLLHKIWDNILKKQPKQRPYDFMINYILFFFNSGLRMINEPKNIILNHMPHAHINVNFSWVVKPFKHQIKSNYLIYFLIYFRTLF